MSIQAAEFVRRVLLGENVCGESVDGEVIFSNCLLLMPHWSGCRFNAAVCVRGCFANSTLSMQGATVEGDVLIDGLTFLPEETEDAGLSLQGLVCSGKVWLRGIAHSRAQIKKISLTTFELLDEFVSGKGMDLSGMRVAQSLSVVNCTRKPCAEETVLSLDFTRVESFAEVGDGNNFKYLTASGFHVHGNCAMTVDDDPVADVAEQKDGDDGSQDILLTNMVCDANLSIRIKNKNVGGLILHDARIGSHLKIRADPNHKGGVELLDLSRAIIGGSALVCDIGLAEGELDGMVCGASLSLRDLRGYTHVNSREKAKRPKLSLKSISVTGNLQLQKLASFASVDAYGARITGNLYLIDSTGLGAVRLDSCQAGMINVLRCVAKSLDGIEPDVGSIGIGKVQPSKLSLRNVSVSGNLGLEKLQSFSSVDADGARVMGDLELIESSDLGAVSLNMCQVRQVNVDRCVAKSLDAIDLHASGFGIWRARIAGGVNMMRSRCQGGVIFSCLVAEELILTAVVVGARLRIDPYRQELWDAMRERKLDEQAKVFHQHCISEFGASKSGDRMEALRKLATDQEFPIITALKRLILDDCEVPLLDLSGAFMMEKSEKGSPAISARRIRARSQFRVRADQFVTEYAVAPAQCKNAPAVLDLAQAEIGELDLGKPLPAAICLRGTTIEDWGVADFDTAGNSGPPMSIAQRYDEVLSRADALELRQYIRIETKLEDEGQRNDADELHRLWRDRARKELPLGIRRSVSWLHRVALGYGTRRVRLVGAMAAVGVAAFAAGVHFYDQSFQISTEMLSGIAECGEPCSHRPLPVLATTLPGKAWDIAQLVLRHGVPLIDLQLASYLEPKPRSAAASAVSLLRVIGWITWPVLLTSLLSGFFPKRHQA